MEKGKPKTGDRGEVIGDRFSSSEMGMGCFMSLWMMMMMMVSDQKR